VADITLFLEFGEVIGAIGLYAMISLTLLLIFHKHTFWFMIVFGSFLFHFDNIFQITVSEWWFVLFSTGSQYG
jgi:hypothetical protein